MRTPLSKPWCRHCRLENGGTDIPVCPSAAGTFLSLPYLVLLTVVVLIAAIAGCKKDDMAVQPKQRTYEPSPVFADGTEARPLVAGTVSRPPWDTPGTPFAYQWSPGPVGAADSVKDDATIPLPVTRELIDRGQERYNIYCAVCHGRLGDANGMIVQRGFIRPPSFHNQRLSDPIKTGDGHFYNVISNGYQAMFSYAERVRPDDRWAITAYIRVLQASVKQAAKDGNITPEEYTDLQGTRQ
jgi:mono/diheme cytochrome c family protein